jgi:hypothetical protein
MNSYTGASRIGDASPVGGLRRVAMALLWLGATACATGGTPERGILVYETPAPQTAERYCAWYGDASPEGVLYFGAAAFWSTWRASGGDPSADLEAEGPQWVGRFDLRSRAWLEPLDVTAEGARSGVWDVFAHANRRVYFTTYFEDMGWVHPESGEVRRLPALGAGLNEIAAGPGDSLLVTRYGASDSGGSVLLVGPDGELLAEHPLEPPAGYTAAPKTAAFDPRRREIWVTTDLLSDAGGPARHDTYVLGADGRELRRLESPEIQFVAFGPDGGGWRAEVEDGSLWLRVAPADGGERRLLLDDAFDAGLDFAQDVKLAPDGSAVVTRWSGLVHVVSSSGEVRTLRLPRLEEGGLYYSGVLEDGGVCVTYCGGVRVVCGGLR